MSQQTKVDVNITQDFTDGQKVQARLNIGAAAYNAFSELAHTVGDLSYQVRDNTAVVDTLAWTKVDIDESVTTEATQLFTDNNLIIGYYFDSATTFRLSMKSTGATRYIYLADQMGYGGGYQVSDSSWTAITMHGFTNSCQFESLIGYDCTADLPVHFEVQFANSSVSSFTTICRYRVLE